MKNGFTLYQACPREPTFSLPNILLPSIVSPANYLLSILVCGHLSHFYHPFMDSVFFFPWEISLYIHLRFCLFFSLCGHYLKVCGPTHLCLVAGRVSAIHDLTPDLMLVWGLGKLLMSHILCGRFWVRILYDDKINLPKSQGRSPTLISVAIILYPNNTMTYYVV